MTAGRLAPQLLHAEVGHDRLRLRSQHGFVDGAVGGGQEAVVEPGGGALQRRVEARRSGERRGRHAGGVSPAGREGGGGYNLSYADTITK